jgi:hypothetical protein
LNSKYRVPHAELFLSLAKVQSGSMCAPITCDQSKVFVCCQIYVYHTHVVFQTHL